MKDARHFTTDNRGPAVMTRRQVTRLILLAGSESLLTGALAACTNPAPAAPTAAPKPTTAPPTTAPAATAAPPAVASLVAKPSGSRAASPAAAASPGVASATANYRATPLNPPITIEVGSVLNTFLDAPRAIAQERGYFAAEGMTVNARNFTALGEALPSLATGQIQAMIGTMNPAAFNALARGVTVQAVADGGSSTGAIIVRQDLIDSGRYKTPADMKGMKVGLPSLYSALHYVLKVFLDTNGLTLKDVEVVATGNAAESVIIIGNKAVDVMVTIEPFNSTIEERKTGKIVARSPEVAPENGGALLFYAPSFSANADASERFMVAWLRGIRDYQDAVVRNRGREEMIALLAKYNINYLRTGTNPVYDPDGKFQPPGLRDLLKWYQDENVVQGQIDLDKLVNTDIVARAARRLGPYI